jgi:hypothetical protein
VSRSRRLLLDVARPKTAGQKSKAAAEGNASAAIKTAREQVAAAKPVLSKKGTRLNVDMTTGQPVKPRLVVNKPQTSAA